MLTRLVRSAPAPLVRWVGKVQNKHRLLKLLARPFAQAVRSKPVVVPRGALRGMVFDAGNANAGYALGTVEPQIQKLLPKLLAPGDVFYDVGANVGFFTLLGAKAVGPTGKVVAFEPLPQNLGVLRHNIALNGLDVEVVAAALGDESGTARFSESVGPTHAHFAPDGEIEVAVMRADDYGGPPPSLVKLDIEGAEVEALEGMRGALAEHRPILLIELHDTNRQVAELLDECGYTTSVVETPELALEDAHWNAHVLCQ